MSLNKAMLLGRLGKDPEIRYTKSGQPVANFSMATDEGYKDAQGKRHDKTEWHNVVAWGKLADTIGGNVKKGQEIYIEGRLQTREWTDKENVKRYQTEIVADRMVFVGKKEGGNVEQGETYEGGLRKDPPSEFEDDQDLPF